MDSMSMAATTTAMAGMAMPTDSTTSSSMSMDMSTMSMTFFVSDRSPLFTKTWTPNSTGQYAGTCIFLIIFAAIFRALLAIRFNLDHVVSTFRRIRGDDQISLYIDESKGQRRPWRASEAVMLGSMDVIIAGIAYLLMIAVMTMNIGYFLSVLAGIFVGSLLFGRFMVHSAAH